VGDYDDIERFPIADEEDVPYEGHSITLRDILIRTGEDSFHLICTASCFDFLGVGAYPYVPRYRTGDGDYLEEGIGDETTGWG